MTSWIWLFISYNRYLGQHCKDSLLLVNGTKAEINIYQSQQNKKIVWIYFSTNNGNFIQWIEISRFKFWCDQASRYLGILSQRTVSEVLQVLAWLPS